MPPQPDPSAVFLNIPYDDEFLELYVAYVVGLCEMGLVPHIAAEIPGGARRLDRIFEQIKSCRYSIHDLSRVELSVAPGAVPRFNMPLELGMTISWQKLRPKQHTWFVWEAEAYRLLRSTSDLNGTDPNLHFGTPEGVLKELRNAFQGVPASPIDGVARLYRFIRNQLDAILHRNGTRNPYDRSVFRELCWLSSGLTALLRRL